MKIELPFLPISVNKCFATNFKTRRRFKTKEYADFQRMVAIFVKRGPIFDGPLRVEIDITRNWFTKAGKPKIIDIANYEKTLVDTLSEILGFEDSMIFELSMRKRQCDLNKELTIVSISPLQ